MGLTKLFSIIIICFSSCLNKSEFKTHKSAEGSYLYALNAETGYELWKIQTVDYATGPAVDSGVIYFGGGNRFYAADKHTGETLWERNTESRTTVVPKIDTKNVYFLTEDGIMHCCKKSKGTTIWDFNTKSVNSFQFGVGTDVVYVSYLDKYLLAIDKASGKEIWSFDAAEYPINVAMEHDSKVIFCSSNTLFCLNANNGVAIWRRNDSKWSPYSTPVFVDGSFYISSFDRNLFRLNLGDGDIEWNHKTNKTVLFIPTIAGDSIYYGTNEKVFFSQLIRSKEILWSLKAHQWFTGEAKRYKDKIYLGGCDGVLYCLRQKNGEIVWKYQTNGPMDYSTTPVVDNGVIFCGSHDGFIVNFDGREVDLRDRFSR